MIGGCSKEGEMERPDHAPGEHISTRSSWYAVLHTDHITGLDAEIWPRGVKDSNNVGDSGDRSPSGYGRHVLYRQTLLISNHSQDPGNSKVGQTEQPALG